MIPAKLREVLDHEGVVAIATRGSDGPHLVNSWNSYVQLTADGRMLIPVGGMVQTEQNVGRDARVLVTVGSREVEGRLGPGTGFLIQGRASVRSEGEAFDAVRARFPWARAALLIQLEAVEQTL